MILILSEHIKANIIIGFFFALFVIYLYIPAPVFENR